MMIDSIHIWHVAKTGNDNNSGHAGQYPINLAANAKLTIQAAVNASLEGDTIYIWPGEYVESINMTGYPNRTMDGINRGAVNIKPYPPLSNVNGILAEDGMVIRNLKTRVIEGTNFGVAADSKKDIWIDNCDIIGMEAGVAAGGAVRMRITNSIILGYYKGLQAYGAIDVVANNCIISVESNVLLPDFGLTAVEAGGVKVDDVRLMNCNIRVVANNIPEEEVIGVLHSCVLHKCSIYVSAAASILGPVYGVKISASNKETLLVNSTVKTVNFGSGATRDLYVSGTGSKICVVGSKYDTTKTYGTIIHGGMGFEAAMNAQVVSATGNIKSKTDLIPSSPVASQASADAIRNILEGDTEIDKTATPWQIVVKNKTTGAELIRKNLKDVNGANVTGTTTVIGQIKEPAV